jgi:hypothetical protein
MTDDSTDTNRPEMDREVWLVDLTHTGRGPASDTVPLAIGYLGAYLQAQVDLCRGLRLFRYPEVLAKAIDAADRPPDLVGFSNYIWNSRLSRRFAELIKENWPGTVVVFGGPNLPLDADQREAYLRECREIDFYVAKEGEVAFAQLIRLLHDNGWRRDELHGRVPSTYSLDGQGRLHHGPMTPRLRTLDEIPSPYLTGLLDEFLDGYLVPSVQTNRGCPFSCTFCVEGESYYSKVSSFSVERVLAELNYIGKRMTESIRAQGRNELDITDSNFGMFAQDEQICAAIGDCVDRYGWPAQVNVTTGKNRRDRILSSIKLARGTIQLSGAVQSLDEAVLTNVNRANIRTSDLMATARNAAESSTRTYSDVILGLPGDSLDAHLATVSALVDGGFGRVNLFQFALLLGAQINNPEVRERFGLRTSYRPIPRQFGKYHVFGGDVIVGEIDEVCVGSRTLSFDDYVAARVYDLCVFLFHNDAVFAATEAALRSLGIPISAWLRHLWQAEWPGALDSIRQLFRAQTAQQLFDSPEEVSRHLASHVDQYLSGEAGNNVLYSARGSALRHAVDELAAAAGASALAVCGAQADKRAHDLLVQAAEFDRLALSGVLQGGPPVEEFQATFDFDLTRLVGGDAATLAELDTDEPVRIRFVLSEPVRATVDTYRLRMGDTDDGIGRALSRIRVNDLRRRAVVAPAAAG